MALLARLSEPQAGRARAAARRTLSLRVPALSAGRTDAALIHNLSEHGLRIETDAIVQTGEIIRVELPEAGAVDARIIWTGGGFAGCRFLTPIQKAAVSAALLRSPATLPASPEPFRVELPMIDVVDRTPEFRRADLEYETTDARSGALVFLALCVGVAVAALFIGSLLLMAVQSSG
ncbi:MAG TPA: PilZ domain-containing protein [Sphingomicrobium sp.]|nr:PilZ domain-containing protein [Sphingomicrobium sp.]